MPRGGSTRRSGDARRPRSRRRGDADPARRAALRDGELDGAAALLAGARWQELAADGHALDAALASLPDTVLAARPRVLLQVARAAEAAGRFGLRTATL